MSNQCPCGRRFACSVPKKFVCVCGEIFACEPEPKRLMGEPTLGGVFRQNLMTVTKESNCGCSDAAALMNRRGTDGTLDTIDELTQIVLRKTKLPIIASDVKNIIRQSVAEYNRLHKTYLESLTAIHKINS